MKQEVKLGGNLRAQIDVAQVVVYEGDRVQLTGTWRKGGYVKWPRGAHNFVTPNLLDRLDTDLRILIPRSVGTVPSIEKVIESAELEKELKLFVKQRKPKIERKPSRLRHTKEQSRA